MHTKDLISHCVHELSIRGAQKLHLRFQSLYKQVLPFTTLIDLSQADENL